MTDSAFMPDVVVEFAQNGGVNIDPTTWTWTDVSDFVELDRGISITSGRSDEQSNTSPMRIALTFDNRDGRFTPELASGAYYPNVQLGRPIRVSASVPAFNGTYEDNITGWTGNNASLVQSATQKRSGSFSMRLQASSAATMSADTPSGTSGFPVCASSEYVAWAWFRAQSTGRTCRVDVDWYNSGGTFISTSTGGNITDSSSAWTRATLSATSPSTAAFARVRTFVVSPANAEQHYVDDVLFGTVRGTAFVDEWTVGWEGGDPLAFTQMTATGRLGAFASSGSMLSVVEQEVLRYDPVVYFPLAESSSATHAQDASGSSYGTGVALEKFDNAANVVEFGNGTGPTTDGLSCVQFAREDVSTARSAGRLRGNFTGPNNASTGWTISAFFAMGSGNTSPTVNLCAVSFADTSATAEYVLEILSGGAPRARNVPNASVGSTEATDSTRNLYDGNVHHIAATCTSTGTLVLWVDGVDGSPVTGTASVFPMTNNPRLVIGGHASSGGSQKASVAHVAVYDRKLLDSEIDSIAASGLTGWANETASARIARWFGWLDTPSASYALDTGLASLSHIPTHEKTIEAVLRTVEQTEFGVVFDDRNGKVRFHDRSRRRGLTSSFTIAAGTQELDVAYSPTLDRSQLLNDVTAKSISGTVAARVFNQTSINDHGLSAGDVEIATDSADVCNDAAGWRVHKYATPKLRVGSLAPVDLLPLSASKIATIACATVGTRFTVSGLPAQAPASSADYVVEGWTETFGPESWRIEFNVSAASLWDSWLLGDATHGQLGTSTVLAI